jgi:hypothetical protein
MKKIIIVLAVLVVIGVTYVVIFTQTDLLVSHYRASDYQQPYYQNLAQECQNKTSVGCCLASVQAMQAGDYQLVPEDGCPTGYERNMMKCVDSYQWCYQKPSLE